MTEYRTDKVSPHGYLPDYQRLAAELGPAAVVCEVGVFHGGSLEMWQDMFPQGAVIGIDRDPDANWPRGTHLICAEQDDPELANIVREHAPDGCDLIVDDASHIGHLTAATFKLLWPLVRPGGFYVVEDWADRWVFPLWQGWSDVDPSLAGDELVDWVPSLIGALKDQARTVTYTYEGLVIIRRALHEQVPSASRSWSEA
jgi:hypothetical protein